MGELTRADDEGAALEPAPTPQPINALSLIKLVMLVLATIFGAYRGIQDLYIALSEPEPATFEAASFDAHYQGEQWIRVSGRLALEHMHVRPSTHEAHEGRELNYLHVPLVAADWTPDTPVRVIATYGPLHTGEIESWKASAHDIEATTGQLRFVPFPDPELLFPALVLAEPLVIINEGTEPNSFGSILFLAIMFVAGGLAIVVLGQILRERREFARAASQAR